MSPVLHLHPVSQRAANQASSPRAHSLMVALLCLACLLCLHRPVFASTDALSLLTTCRSVHHLTVEEANRHHPVRLRAAVSYYEAATDATGPSLFVVDSSGSVFVALAGSPASPLIPGDQVEVTGISSGADFAPVVAQAAARWVGRSALPRTAPRVDIGNMLSGTKDGQWVEMEAVVHSVQFDGVAATLSLFMQGGVILGRTPIERGVDYNHLVDAKILLRGNAAPLFNHITEDDICVGDTIRLGTALVQVSGPRVPCANLARRIGRADWVRLTIRENRTGFYLRVLEPGIVQAGDKWLLTERLNPDGSIPAINRCMYLDFDASYARLLLGMPGLEAWWQEQARQKLENHQQHWTSTLKDD